MSDERDHGNRHAPEPVGEADSVPRPQEARCEYCKTLGRPGLLCKNCGRLVRIHRSAKELKTPGYNQLPEGY